MTGLSKKIGFRLIKGKVMFGVDEIIENWNVRIKKKDIQLFLFLFSVGLITYSSMIIYELPNPDAIWNGLYYKESWVWECSLGRYMIRIFQALFGNIINPPSYTILCIALLSLICIIIKNLYEIRGIAAVLTGIMIILSPATASTLSYYYCSLYYIFAYLLAVIVAWIMCKGYGLGYSIVGMLLLCISLATYQAYIGVVLVLGVMFIIFRSIDNDTSVRIILNRIVYMFVILLGGITSYLVSCKVIQNIWSVVPENARGFAEMGNIPFEKVSLLLKNCYIYTYQYFFSNEMINNEYGFKDKLNLLVFFIITVIFLKKIIKIETDSCRRGIALISFGILPIALMSITIAASNVSIYESTGVIMLPTMNYMYVFLLCLVYKERKEDKIGFCMNWSGVLVSIVLAFSAFAFCMFIQTYHKYSMNRMNFLTTGIVQQIEEQIEYSEAYRICFIGQAEKGNYPELYPELLNRLHWVTASQGTVWKDFLGTQECWRMYIRQYTGKHYKICSNEEYEEIIQSDFFKTMNSYPDDNSVAVYNESVVVIKLSEWDS